MKFHALTLCLAGAVAASAAYADEHNRKHSDRMHENTAGERVDRSNYPQQNGFYTKRNWKGGTYTQEFPYYKERAWAYGPVTDVMPEYIVYYPDLPSLSDVARKVAEIHHHNAMEAAELRALSNRARGLGWTNIAAVYDQIASDHSKGATMASNWLTDNDFPAPAMPTTTTVSDTMSETDVRNSVDRVLDMHVRNYEETLNKLRGEKSSTVRGMYLMSLATMQRHITLLRMLDRDVDRDRRDLSARLNAELDATRTARSSIEWDTLIYEEEWSRFVTDFPNTTTVAATPYVVPPDAEVRIVERPVIVERIVERPVPAAAPPTVVSVPRTYETQPAIDSTPRSTVAGQRQVRSRRARRPAK